MKSLPEPRNSGQNKNPFLRNEFLFWLPFQEKKRKGSHTRHALPGVARVAGLGASQSETHPRRPANRQKVCSVRAAARASHPPARHAATPQHQGWSLIASMRPSAPGAWSRCTRWPTEAAPPHPRCSAPTRAQPQAPHAWSPRPEDLEQESMACCRYALARPLSSPGEPSRSASKP